MTDSAEARARVAEAQRDLWAAYAAMVLTDAQAMREHITELQRTVRLLRVQLPLIPHAVPCGPDGPDPRWAARIPTQRVPPAPVSRSRAAVQGASH